MPISFLISLRLLLLFLLFCSPSFSVAYPFNISYRIDCGGLINSTDQYNTSWISDRFYTGGQHSVVSEPLLFKNNYEKTIRFFPLSSGKKNCYVVANLPLNARFFFRTFTVYDNYDGKHSPPSFEVSVEGTQVFSWIAPWPNSVPRFGAYSDLFAFVKDGEADVCFYSIATDSPLIGSLEIVEVDPLSYDSPSIGDNQLLVNYGRFSCGSTQWGPGFSGDPDSFGRSWQADSQFRSRNSKGVEELETNKLINGTNQKPNYFPTKLYQTAVTGEVEYELSVDAKLDYLLWFHFAEIDEDIHKTGQRVFDVMIDRKIVNRVDIVREAGVFTALTWHYTLKNLSSNLLTVKLVPVVGDPLISGLENYALVPTDLSTLHEQVVAMKALKDSLRIPGRMGWNGDPCAPSNWDAWEGVTCNQNKDGSALVVSQIDLGSQGLKGFISDQISLLTNLVILNLTSNSLGGTIPLGLGQKSLSRLDLSHNEFSGSIPDSISTSGLQLVLLNDNLLEGRVPEKLYSIGVHGGIIDLSGNKGLCGVPSLPACPAFWKNGHLTTGGLIAIIISCVVFLFVILLVVYVCCLRKRNNDYDFAPPHDLMSLSAKRNRYQRQKSLMLLEMESQHAKGLPITPNSR